MLPVLTITLPGTSDLAIGLDARVKRRLQPLPFLTYSFHRTFSITNPRKRVFFILGTLELERPMRATPPRQPPTLPVIPVYRLNITRLLGARTERSCKERADAVQGRIFDCYPLFNDLDPGASWERENESSVLKTARNGFYALMPIITVKLGLPRYDPGLLTSRRWI